MGRRPTEVQVSGQAGQEARPTLLRVAGAGYRDLLDPAATEVLQQQNHLVFLVLGTPAAEAAARALEIGNGFGQLRAGAHGPPRRFENTAAQELGDELQLIPRKARQKAP
jgi:hypothetical protein